MKSWDLISQTWWPFVLIVLRLRVEKKLEQLLSWRINRETYNQTSLHYARGVQKVMQHIYFLGPVLSDKNILRAAAFKCLEFMHTVVSFPAR
jgi:hypothetical protein